MKEERNIKYLLGRYLNREATEEEVNQLFAALEEVDATKWEQVVHSFIEEQQADPDYNWDDWEPMIKNIFQKTNTDTFPSKSTLDDDEIKTKKRIFGFSYSRVGVAAAIIVLLGIGAWFGWQNHAQEPEMAATDAIQSAQDIHPGGNKAILTLANGKKILLDSVHNGILSTQGNTKVIKLNQGLLSYNGDTKTDVGGTPEYNTITTPVGGQYKVVLPDGSSVWLNAASSIRFPVVFSGKERRVFMKGEAYFEVAKNEKQPFLVTVNDMQVKVLGTHFNIMAYEDEPAVQTTLLEGKVKIVSDEAQGIERSRRGVVLNPGQEASIAAGTDDIKVTETNTEEVVAWKNGFFEFSNTNIATIMRSISRWYDVEINYPDGVPSGEITGKIPRHTNLSDVLKIMRLSGVHFEVKGREVKVLNS